VNGQAKAELFDVFLCHNGEDKPAVREIAQKLVTEGIKPWLDEEQIRPGTSWQTALGEQIESIKSAVVFVGDAGIGPWQNQESQALLNQFVKRGCPVIPVVLASATTTPDLPWTLTNLHRVDFRTDSQPLERLIWGITGQKPAELSDVHAPKEPATMQEVVKTRLIDGKQERAAEEKVPALTQAPDQDNTTQLNILRKRVSEYWVDGVLKHSLYNEVLIPLDKREVDQNVDAPWKYIVEVSDVDDSTPSDDRNVSAIYDTTGLLLILGEPGSGKTTTLLDLARTLLERAKDDIKERVPIVVNLSSWRKKLPLAEWMSNELSEKYRVPRKIANLWLQQDYLLPLLDGLDELATVLQPDCVAAINAFIEESNPSGLVVCSRLNNYRWLPKRLKLNGAICIEPLSSEEVSQYLANGGPSLAALRGAVDADPVLNELAQTPLMLSIMSLAFQGAGSDELTAQKGNSDERRNQIFGLYVEQMFQRKGMTALEIPKVKIIGWLSWLAEKMKEHSQSVFLVEGLQPSWLDTKAQWVVYKIMGVLSIGLLGGLISGLIYGLLYGQLVRGLLAALICGLLGGLPIALLFTLFGPSLGALIGGLSEGTMLGVLLVVVGLLVGVIYRRVGSLAPESLSDIHPVETMRWSWNQFREMTVLHSMYGLRRGLRIGLICGLIGGLLVGLIYGLGEGLLGRLLGGLIGTLLGGLIGSVFNGLFSGLIYALFIGCGFTNTVKASNATPNAGIKLSWRNSLTAFLIIFLTVGPLAGSMSGLFGGWVCGVHCGLISGLFVGLIGGSQQGGSAVIKHYSLRLILWLNGKTPLNFIKFLDQCAKLIFLKKVGGGYIFVHRMLLDYFADLPQPTKGGNGKAESVQS
jgi:hypothetical protein